MLLRNAASQAHPDAREQVFQTKNLIPADSFIEFEFDSAVWLLPLARVDHVKIYCTFRVGPRRISIQTNSSGVSRWPYFILFHHIATSEQNRCRGG
jgi:hypothetical protein